LQEVNYEPDTIINFPRHLFYGCYCVGATTPRLEKDKNRKGRPPAILIMGSAPGYSLADWKEWIIEDEGFAAAFPEFPFERTRPIQSGDIKFDWREYLIHSSTGSYEVRIADSFGRRLESKASVKKRLEMIAQVTAKDPENTDVRSTFLEISGHPAVDTKMKDTKLDQLIWIRMTMVDGRIYQLNVEVPAKQEWTKEADIFMNSFRLLEDASLKTEPETIYPASAGIVPKIISQEKANYTALARKNGVEGIVTVSAVFGADGKIRGIHIVQGLPDGLNQEAKNAAAKTKFIPAVKDGKPVSVKLNMEFNFQLN
jgi:TonB family protein